MKKHVAVGKFQASLAAGAAGQRGVAFGVSSALPVHVPRVRESATRS
jgi:hypothetical protein